MKPKRENLCYVYQDKAGRWRWRLKAPNGKILSTSGEGDGFSESGGAIANFKRTGGNADVVVLTKEQPEAIEEVLS